MELVSFVHLFSLRSSLPSFFFFFFLSMHPHVVAIKFFYSDNRIHVSHVRPFCEKCNWKVRNFSQAYIYSSINSIEPDFPLMEIWLVVNFFFTRGPGGKKNFLPTELESLGDWASDLKLHRCRGPSAEIKSRERTSVIYLHLAWGSILPSAKPAFILDSLRNTNWLTSRRLSLREKLGATNNLYRSSERARARTC